MDNIEERMAEMILSEILESNLIVSWNDIAGLEFAKRSVMEIVVYPLWRPELFHGIRKPAKGLLLFGPPVRSSHFLSHFLPILHSPFSLPILPSSPSLPLFILSPFSFLYHPYLHYLFHLDPPTDPFSFLFLPSSF